MKTVKVKHVDAFTRIPHTGNPSAVVIDADSLSDEEMRSIAREINLSETAFILPPVNPDADLRIRWFSATSELPMSGHSTVACFHALSEHDQLGMVDEGRYHFILEKETDLLEVSVEKDEKGSHVAVKYSLPEFERASQYKVDLVRLLNISINEFDQSLTVQRNGFLFAPLRRLHSVFSLKPNLPELANFLDKRNIDGLCVFTTETIDRNSLVHSRVFAPHIGIDEDPVTGLTHRSLGLYLYEKDLIEPKEGRFLFRAEQGDVIGRKGRLDVEIVVEDNKPVSVVIGGNAVTVLDGEMRLPN